MQQVVNGLTLTFIYVLFSLGITLSWGTLRILNLAHGAIFVLAGYLGYVVTTFARLPLPVILLVAAAVAGVASCLVHYVFFQYIRRVALTEAQAELRIMIASSGLAIIPVTIAQNLTHDTPFRMKTSYRVIAYTVGSVHILNIQIVIVVLGLILTGLTAAWVRYTRNGRGVRALGLDAETSELVGINTVALSVRLMLVSGAFAGVASALFMSYLGALTPESGDNLLVKGFSVVVLGGIGSIVGTFVGALVLAGAETAVLANTSGSWVDAISFAVIIVVILARPNGLFGRRSAERV